MTGLDLTLVLQLLYWIALKIEGEIVKEAERVESGKLEVIQASLLTLKTSRDPKERREAALKLKQARGR